MDAGCRDNRWTASLCTWPPGRSPLVLLPSQGVGSAWVSLILVGCRCTSTGVYSQNGDKPKRRQSLPTKVFQAQAWTCDRTSSLGLPPPASLTLRWFVVICGDLRCCFALILSKLKRILFYLYKSNLWFTATFHAILVCWKLLPPPIPRWVPFLADLSWLCLFNLSSADLVPSWNLGLTSSVRRRSDVRPWPWLWSCDLESGWWDDKGIGHWRTQRAPIQFCNTLQAVAQIRRCHAM